MDADFLFLKGEIIMLAHYSPTFVAQVGPYPAMVYDYVVRWICTNAEKKRRTAEEDGKIWTYGTLDYYANALGMNKRTFRATIAFLVKHDYLQIKYNPNSQTFSVDIVGSR